MRSVTRYLGPRPGDFPLGSMESRAAARAALLALDIEAQEQLAALCGNLTPLEQAFCEIGDNPRSKAGMLMIVNVMIQKSQLFGFPLPTPEEVRHRWRISQEVDKIEQERAARGDTAFLDEKSVREMAEERLRREHRGIAQTGSTATEAAAD